MLEIVSFNLIRWLRAHFSWAKPGERHKRETLLLRPAEERESSLASRTGQLSAGVLLLPQKLPGQKERSAMMTPVVERQVQLQLKQPTA